MGLFVNPLTTITSCAMATPVLLHTHRGAAALDKGAADELGKLMTQLSLDKKEGTQIKFAWLQKH